MPTTRGGKKRHPDLRDRAGRDDLVRQYKDLPRHVARKLLRLPDVARLGIDDAAQEGALGLLRAASLWDPKYGIKFVTYAYRACAQCITRAARQQADLVALPEYARRAGRTPARWVRPGRPADDIAMAQAEGHAYGRWEPADPGEGPPEGAGRGEAAARLAALLRVLDPRSREVLLRRAAGVGLAEVAAGLGVTRERVRQLQLKALARVRKFAGVK